MPIALLGEVSGELERGVVDDLLLLAGFFGDHLTQVERLLVAELHHGPPLNSRSTWPRTRALAAWASRIIACSSRSACVTSVTWTSALTTGGTLAPTRIASLTSVDSTRTSMSRLIPG